MASSSGAAVAWIALFAGAAGIGLALKAGKQAPVSRDAESETDLLDAKSMENRLNDAEGRLESAQKRIAALEERLTKAERTAEEAAGLARSAAGAVAGAVYPTGAPADGGKGTEKPTDGESLLAQIREGRIPEDGTFALFQKAKDLGVLDEALKEMEKYAAAHPGDADVQVELASAYIVKLMAVPDGMERGTWSMKSLAACENALKIDPEHWDAQFTKGMNLSQWPAFLGKQPEAIRTFEKLIEQQERGAPDPGYAQTYYQLGNTYRTAGNLEKARKVFTRGLELFPEDKQLREQLDLLDKK